MENKYPEASLVVSQCREQILKEPYELKARKDYEIMKYLKMLEVKALYLANSIKNIFIDLDRRLEQKDELNKIKEESALNYTFEELTYQAYSLLLLVLQI